MPSVNYKSGAVLKAQALAAMVDAVDKGGEAFVGVAMEETPVDEGTLRASITKDATVVAGSGAQTRVHTSGEANDYAFYVHEGTRKMSANPYMERAAIRFAPAFKAFMAAAVRKAF